MFKQSCTWRSSGMLLGLCLLAGQLISCGPINPTVTEESDGGSYRLLLGATLTVQLTSTAPGDGCSWFTAGNLNFVKRIDNDFFAPGLRSQLDDGTWVETFKFQGVTRGTTELNLEKRCNDVATGDTFTMRLDVVSTGI